MGWNIGLLVNTVKVPKKCAKEIYKVDKDLWFDEEYVTDREGKLNFNSDHHEWMDYLSNYETSKPIIDLLTKYKVKGRICFGSLEGDNRGKFWGHHFDGEGNYMELKGDIVWS